MMKRILLLVSFIGLCISHSAAQLLVDDFEGNSTINEWLEDDCNLTNPFPNPFRESINTSQHVLRYHDIGGTYANVYFDSPDIIYIGSQTVFTLKVYLSSNGTTGNQPNQISLKLQNNRLGAPWTTQSEIIKPLIPDVWQEVRFDFANDAFININPSSPQPKERTDLNRVLIQINGENNNHQVLAFLDDFHFEGEVEGSNDPVYDRLVWSDEFEVDGPIDSDKWFHQTILPLNGNSWFNGEIQHYTDRMDNSYVQDGSLRIVAKKETFNNQGVTKNYTSARLNSKFAFTYGRVEVKAKLPTGVGTWPAIWMLGKNIREIGTYWDIEGYGTTPWPACGEIDIMEHWGNNQNFVQSAMHTPSSFGGTINHGGQIIPTASTAYHVYALDWYPDRMVFSVDDVVHYTYRPEVKNKDTWPFDEDQFILLNIAIEGSIHPNFTQSSMDIAYVRVYQESTNATQSKEEALKLVIAPNPIENNTSIYAPSEAVGAPFAIFDIHGKNIHHGVLQSDRTEINCQWWSPGVYILKVWSTAGAHTYKLLKM
jgi:beta-glucanase (GH16 family)